MQTAVGTLASTALSPETGGPRPTWTTLVLSVTYQDGKDPRRFHIGDRASLIDNGILSVETPVPSRDWQERRTETVTMEFLRRAPTAVQLTLAQPLADPVAEPETLVDFIATPPGVVSWRRD